MKQYAVIDLGTNTFHLLIASQTASGALTVTHRERFIVKLAEDGIDTIGQIPFDRGIHAMNHFHKILQQYQPSSIKAFGTAALRTASNGLAFTTTIKKQTGIHIDIIPGDEEARLIYLGVKQIVDFQDHNDLIMDIGGGSVEFIIANKNGVQWARSFPIGVAVLFNQFHKSDPITKEESAVIENYLTQILSPLFKALLTMPVHRLIGASGTFDVLEQNLVSNKEHPHRSTIDVKDFFPIYHQLTKMTLAQRFGDKQVPDSRAELIVVALILIHFIINKTAVKKIVVSAYAMKEGMLKELMNKNI